MMRRTWQLVAMMMALIALIGCQKQSQSGSVQAPADMRRSFQAVAPKSIEANATFQLSISRESLEKEFLLQGELIPQVTAAMGSSLKSRIVAFRERAGKLYMLEASSGHVVTTDLPPNILLAEFEIVRSDANQIVFEFNQGMSHLFVLNDMGASDLRGKMYNGQAQFRSLEVARSFLESVKVDDNRMILRQVAQVKVPNGLMPVEVRYYLSPYQPNANYQALHAPATVDRFGYFQTIPQLTASGNTAIFTNRWNPKDVITYAISANTPADFKQAVKEGILYWNKVAGQELIKVVDGPVGVTAPDVNYNVVQWVPFDTAGFAYADMQSDPRTGEIRHAQIFLTSAFAFHGKSMARILARKLRGTSVIPGASAPNGSVIKATALQLSGFEHEAICDYDVTAGLAGSLETLLTADVDDATILKASQDYVRFVTAHEVGHTLGLRHNFAGSLAGNYPLNLRNDLVAKYFAQKATPPGVVITSSVMDYLRPEEDFMAGDQMARGSVLTYDERAIASLYKNTVVKSEDWPLFCTDSSIGQYYDCNVFDVGPSPLEFSSWQATESLRLLPNGIIEQYIQAKTPLEGDEALPVENVVLDSPGSKVQMVVSWRQGLMDQLGNTAAILKIERQYSAVGDFNQDQVQKEQLQYLSSEVKRLGGLEKLFAPLADDFVAKNMIRLDELLQTVYRQGIGLGDKSYSFSDDEIKIVKANARVFFEKFAKEYRKQELKVLGGVDVKGLKFVEADLADQLGIYLAKRARDTVFTPSGATIVADIEVPNPDLTPGAAKTVVKTVKVQKFAYSIEERMLAAALLNSERSADLTWMLGERAALHDDVQQLLTDAFGPSVDKVKLSKLPKDLAVWLYENSRIVASIK